MYQINKRLGICHFRAWSTRGIELEICVIDMEMNVIECQKVSMARSPAPVSHRFQISKPFMVVYELIFLFSMSFAVFSFSMHFASRRSTQILTIS